MWKNLTLLLCSGLLAVVTLTGCRTAVTSQGTPCYGISESQKRKLIETARVSLSRSNRMVTGAEYKQYVANEEPTVKEKYNGDMFGSVHVTWKLPKKRVSIIFHGELMTREMRSTAEVVPTPGEDDIIYSNVPGKDAPAIPRAKPTINRPRK